MFADHFKRPIEHILLATNSLNGLTGIPNPSNGTLQRKNN